MAERRVEPQGPDRRVLHGQGGPVPDEALALLRAGRGGPRRWSAAGRAAGPGTDQVEAERLLWALLDAGLVAVRQRRDRRGDWEPYQWWLTPAGEALVAPPPQDTPDLDAWLARPDHEPHPVLVALRAWLPTADPAAIVTRVALAIGDELRAGRTPRGRLLSVQVGGHTKAVRLQDHREALEAALGAPLDEVVRLHGRAVFTYGAFRLQVQTQSIDGRLSVPWLALTPETLDRVTALTVSARRMLTVENLVAFEEEVRAGLPDDTVAVWTGGFPSSLERAWMARLVAGGVTQVDHWGDLDVGGLRIFRHLQQILPCPVRPWRMEPELLDRLPTQPLTARDREALRAWRQDPDAPLQALAEALLARGVKAEQEGWWLRRGG